MLLTRLHECDLWHSNKQSHLLRGHNNTANVTRVLLLQRWPAILSACAVFPPVPCQNGTSRCNTETAAACERSHASASESSQKKELPSPALVRRHHLAKLPRTPAVPTLQEREVLLCIYFKAAGLSLLLRRRDRGRVRCMRNSSLVGPCEYITLTNIGGV